MARACAGSIGMTTCSPLTDRVRTFVHNDRSEDLNGDGSRQPIPGASALAIDIFRDLDDMTADEIALSAAGGFNSRVVTASARLPISRLPLREQ